MGTIARFKELHAGQSVPVYSLNGFDFNVIIPREFGPLLSNPDFSNSMLYFVKRSKLSVGTDHIPGVFKFEGSFSSSGFSFFCEYNYLTKLFDLIRLSYDGYFFSTSGQNFQEFLGLITKTSKEMVQYLFNLDDQSRVKHDRLARWLKSFEYLSL
jgi:hypothetical protein